VHAKYDSQSRQLIKDAHAILRRAIQHAQRRNKALRSNAAGTAEIIGKAFAPKSA
jgi:hypothetical protein